MHAWLISGDAHIVIVTAFSIVIILGHLDSPHTRIKSNLTLQTSLNYCHEVVSHVEKVPSNRNQQSNRLSTVTERICKYVENRFI